jgi:hypothetical protein
MVTRFAGSGKPARSGPAISAHPSAPLARWPGKMMKKLAFACAPLLALAACADEPEVVRKPDPALIERIAIANTARSETPEKLEKADRLVATVARVEPDRVAGAAEKLLAR